MTILSTGAVAGFGSRLFRLLPRQKRMHKRTIRILRIGLRNFAEKSKEWQHGASNIRETVYVNRKSLPKRESYRDQQRQGQRKQNAVIVF
jgi:hypothetical protein